MRRSKKVRRLVKAAKMGKLRAMYLLGLRYEAGTGVPQDLGEAAVWMSVAAEEGYAPAVLWMRDYLFDDGADVQAEA